MIPTGWRNAEVVTYASPAPALVVTTIRDRPLFVERTFSHFPDVVQYPNGFKEPHIVDMNYYARFLIGEEPPEEEPSPPRPTFMYINVRLKAS